MKPLPYGLNEAQKSLIAGIEAAFEGVSREGGISWSEAEALDAYAPPAEQAAARAKDGERRWQDLVDDPTWPSYDNPASWSFLDPIGFRYYLPAALVREVMLRPFPQGDHHIVDHLAPYPQVLLNLNERQLEVLLRVAQFMIAVGRRQGSGYVIGLAEWQRVRKAGEIRLRGAKS